MSTVFSTTLVSLAVITSATFALCFKVIDVPTWEWIIGISGGGAGALHVSSLTNGKIGLSSGTGPNTGA